MNQSCTLKNIADILFHLYSETGIFLVYQYAFSFILTQRFCQRRDFHGMGQSRTDKITFIQWKYLCLILKSPK